MRIILMDRRDIRSGFRKYCTFSTEYDHVLLFHKLLEGERIFAVVII